MLLGPVMLDLVGTGVTREELPLLRHPMTGGVILFARNFESARQLRTLVDDIHAVRDPRLLVAVDHEGGRIQRFRAGFTGLPAARCFGDLYEVDPDHACALAEAAGWLLAAELRAVDIDFSFAPVLDVAHGLSAVIGDRAFHRAPEVVAVLARCVMQGMNAAGMAAVGKHFPGHGAVSEDSHTSLPVDSRSLATIESSDMVPFRQLTKEGLAGVMPAHVMYPEVDRKPAGFSRYWLQTVLRGQLGFEGAIFSDDLGMAGAAVEGDLLARARAALDAGCDMVLPCNSPQALADLLDGLAGAGCSPPPQQRLLQLQGRGAPDYDELRASEQWQRTISELSTLLPTNEH